ncbi:type II toxin-antitoxin system VapC family toxin [Intrasporangium sp.]|uniref:type II toxin-antitoxin system VapC family toxin n=1 Tax=Intrasporangium sp. TaxID=1925024 RepID=UPI003221AD6E
MIVLDANVLIAHLDATDTHHLRARAALASSGDEPLAVSPITLAEVLVGPARLGRLDQALGALAQLEVTAVEFVRDAPVRLAMLRAETALKLPDCCVLLAAEQTPGALVTFDERLASAARDRGIELRAG